MKQRPQSRREKPGFHKASPRPSRGRFLISWGGSLAAHLIVIAALFGLIAGKRVPREPSAIAVNLVQVPRPQPAAPPGPPGPAGLPDAAKANAAVPQPAPQPVARPVRRAAAAPAVEAAAEPVDDYSDMLSDADLAGAASADPGGGNGGGGGGCDMAGALQRALRKDPLVPGAVADAHRLGKAVMLWNGDWVRAGSQDGKGLSAVREAIIWELAFAPAACRNKPMHGLVLLSLSDGRTRFAIGAGQWRWSDLLELRAE